MSQDHNELDDLLAGARDSYERWKGAEWATHYRRETETGGWYQSYGDVERYWEPGMDRVRIVKNGYVEYRPYMTSGKDS